MSTWLAPDVLEILAEATPDGIAVVDARHVLVRANEPAQALFSAVSSAYLADPLEHVLDSAELAELIADASESPQTRGMTFARRDGTVYCARVTAVRDAGSAFTLLHFSDATDLLDAQRRLQSLFDGHPQGIIRVSLDGNVLEVNDAILRMGGYSREELIGEPFTPMVSPEDASRSWAAFRRAAAGERVDFDVRASRAGGTPLVAEVTLLPQYAGGRIEGVYALLKDVTQERIVHDRLRMEAERMRDLYALAAAAEYTNRHLESALKTGCRLLGAAAAAIVSTGDPPSVEIRHDALELFGVPDRTLIDAAFACLRADQNVPTGDVDTGRLRSWIGTRIYAGNDLHGTLLFFSAERREVFEELDRETTALIAALVGAAIERRRSRAHLRRLAYYDPLTSLPNRYYFQERLRDAIDLAHAGTAHVAVLVLDVDRFSDTNDTLGHAMGDRMMRLVADRLNAAAGTQTVLARSGGDEFMLMAPDSSSAAAAQLAGTILDALGAPFEVDGYEQFYTASIGVALYPQSGDDVHALMKNAGIALVHRKSLGGNGFTVYDATFDARKQTRLSQEKRLRRAIAQGELVLHYQPIVECRTNRITGFEALVRWQHPEEGLLGPDLFIPVAEASGLILPLGEWVAQAAASQLAAWRERYPWITTAINLSPRQFHQRDLPERFGAALATAGCPASAMQFEITETMTVTEAAWAADAVAALKQLGAAIAIDDFGTGHSSLTYLRRFAVDHLKIDRSFVAGIGSSPQDETLVRAIITLGHALDLTVVAEGVETPEQLQFLQAEACDLLQGFLFSPAVAQEDAERLLLAGGHCAPRWEQPRP